jgi:PE-PGRS family protein
VQDADLVVHLGPDNGSGERQAGPVVGGEGGLGEQSARVGGVARGGELSEVAAVPGQEDDVDVVAQGPGAGPGGQPDGAGEHNAADGPAGDGDERELTGAADDQPPFAHVDARAVAADVDDLVGVGGALDVMVGVDGRVGAGEVDSEEAGALGDAAAASAALPADAAGPGDEADEVDGARAADDGGEDRQGVLDVEVGEVVLDVGAQDVAVAVVAQGGEVVDGVVGSDAGAVGEGAGGHDPVGVVRDGVDDGALDDAVADGGDVQDAGLTGSALGDVGAQERGGEVGALAQGGGQLGEEAVEVSGDEAGLALEEAVAGVPDQDHLPGAGQALDRAEAFERRGRGGGGRGGGLGGVGEGGAQRVEALAEVLVRAGECRAVGATAAMEGAGSSARGVRGARDIRLFAVSGGFRIHLHCTPRRVSRGSFRIFGGGAAWRCSSIFERTTLLRPGKSG